MPARARKRATSSRRVNAISLLMQDHKKVKRLLKQLDNTTERAADRRESLFEQIQNELKIHTQLEEEIFYPAYRRRPKSLTNISIMKQWRNITWSMSSCRRWNPQMSNRKSSVQKQKSFSIWLTTM
jgi:iron-sulfur cluster repair protein YtfE (RIC family)